MVFYIINGILNHGGKFQPSLIATLMEKIYLDIATNGRIMFAQVTKFNQLVIFQPP